MKKIIKEFSKTFEALWHPKDQRLFQEPKELLIIFFQPFEYLTSGVDQEKLAELVLTFVTSLDVAKKIELSKEIPSLIHQFEVKENQDLCGVEFDPGGKYPGVILHTPSKTCIFAQLIPAGRINSTTLKVGIYFPEPPTEERARQITSILLSVEELEVKGVEIRH